jgi:hypothetical protein
MARSVPIPNVSAKEFPLKRLSILGLAALFMLTLVGVSAFAADAAAPAAAPAAEVKAAPAAPVAEVAAAAEQPKAQVVKKAKKHKKAKKAKKAAVKDVAAGSEEYGVYTPPTAEFTQEPAPEAVAPAAFKYTPESCKFCKGLSHMEMACPYCGRTPVAAPTAQPTIERAKLTPGMQKFMDKIDTLRKGAPQSSL